jgi:hypothetical protein
MSRITGTETLSLMEAYQSVYSSQQSLEEEIFESVAYALISQGYTATDVLEYFANTDDEMIIEDIVALSEGTLIIENVVSEEYIEEQYEILNEALPAIAAGLGLAGRALLGAGARRTAGAVIKRMAGPGVRKAVGGAVKKIGGAVSKVKDLAKGALNKVPGGSGGKLASAAKTAGKWALGGAAFEAGARGVKALAGDKGSAKTAPAKPSSPKAGMVDTDKGQKYKSSSDGKMYKNYNDALAARNSRRGVKPTPAPAAAAPSSTPAPAASSSPAPSSTPAKPKVAPSKPAASEKPAIGKLGNTSFERRTPTSAELKAAQAARASGASPEKTLQAAQKTNLPTQGNPDAKVDTKAADAALKAQQDRDKNKAKPQAVNASYEYDAYDLVLEYLLSRGHVDTVEEANYVMMKMDAEMIGNIVEAKVDEKLPEHERSGARLKRYDNPSGALALGGGQQRARREEHKERRGKKVKV